MAQTRNRNKIKSLALGAGTYTPTHTGRCWAGRHYPVKSHFSNVHKPQPPFRGRVRPHETLAAACVLTARSSSVEGALVELWSLKGSDGGGRIHSGALGQVGFRPERETERAEVEVSTNKINKSIT